MLSASHLTRRFGDRTAVDDLSVDIAPGEVFALLGPNGAGKTTTLRMLAGLIEPTSGIVRIDARPMFGRTADTLRRRIGFLTEAPGLWDRLTVSQNLTVYARLQGLANPGRAVAEVLDTFGLEDRASQPAAHLSKGLKQRVALAHALLHGPDIVLLDEPTAGLDPEMAREVREVILRLRGEKRVVIVSTHNLDEVERVASRVAVLRTRLIAVDTPAALRSRLFGARVRVTLAQPASSFVGALGHGGFRDVTTDGNALSIGVPEDGTAAPRIVRLLVEAGAEITSVTSETAPLEEVYLRLLQADQP